jgi:DNA-binding MarR family transcriptional regulator
MSVSESMDKVELITKIIELQRKADRARRQYQLDIWMDLPLTIAQLKSLFFISNQGSSNLMMLASALGVTPTTTTGIIDRLVKHGLVSRTENPENRRMLLLRATDKGEELVANLRKRRSGYMSDALERMSVAELTAIAQGFALLVKTIQAYEEERKDVVFTSSTDRP